MCIGHSSRNKQQPLNPWVFSYKSLVLACKVSTSTELERNRDSLLIAPSQSPCPWWAATISGRERPFLNGSPIAVNFAVPLLQPKKCPVMEDRASWALILFTSCSQKGFPPLLPMSSVHQSGSQDLAVWPSHLQISTSALVAATHVALQWTVKGWIVKDFISAHPFLCCPYFLPPPAHCTRRLCLGGREGVDEARVAGRKAKVLRLTRWFWTRLGHAGLHERTSVVFFLAVSALALSCRSEHCAAIFSWYKGVHNASTSAKACWGHQRKGQCAS